MARTPGNFQWLGFDAAQLDLLNFIDHLGNNGWDRNGQTDEIMPGVLADCEAAGLSVAHVKGAMQAIGYDVRTLRQLDRWESKRTTGDFGR